MKTLEHITAVIVALVVVVLFRYVWHDLLHLHHTHMVLRWVLREFHILQAHLPHFRRRKSLT